MSVEEIHVGDIGTVLEITIYDGDAIVDISGATVKQIKLRKPSGSVVTKTASFSTNGQDGKVRYVTQDNDLNEHGYWQIQGYVELGGGEWHTNVEDFLVHKNL